MAAAGSPTGKRANIADFRLSIDGEDFSNPDPVAAALGIVDITARVRPRLISLSLTEKRGSEADDLEIVLDDGDGRLSLPRKGAIIRLQLGWRQGGDVTVGLVDKGRFKVDEASWSGAPDQVTIRARSADLTGAFRKRREKGHKDTTLGAIAREVAAANGLEARVDPDLAGIAVPILTQHHESDMALLRRLGRQHDAVATVKDGKLILSPIGKGATASGKTLPSIVLTRVNGDGFKYSEVDRSAGAGVEARWHDPDAGIRKTVKVGGGNGTPKRLRKVHHSEADARAAAKAEASRSKRGEATFEMSLALGQPGLYPETAVQLIGFKPPIDARKWIIAELGHRLEARGGLTTSLKLETKA